MSRDDYHARLGTLDETQEATADEYTDQVVLDLYAQWKPAGAPTKPASSNTPKTGDALTPRLSSALIAIALASAALALYSMRRKRMETDTDR